MPVPAPANDDPERDARTDDLAQTVTTATTQFRQLAAESSATAGHARLAASGAVGRAADAQAVAAEARRQVDQAEAAVADALKQARASGLTAEQSAGVARRAETIAEQARAEQKKLPSLLDRLRGSLDAAISSAADLASQALKKITDLGVVVRTLEQRGYVLVAHYSDGSEKVVARIGHVVVAGGGGGGPPPNTGAGAGAAYGLLSISANTLLPAGRYIVLVDASVAAFTATMPDPTQDASSEYIFFRVDNTPTNPVTIAAANAGKVNQAASQLLLWQNDAAHFRSTGIAFGWIQSS